MKHTIAGIIATVVNAAVAAFDPSSLAAAACTYLALVTGLLTAIYIAYGIAIRIEERQIRRIEKKRLDNDLLREISDGYNAHDENERNNQHRGYGETGDSD